MPRTELIKNNFNGGELSPNVLGRTDLAKYHNACESIKNFIPRVQGGLVRRSGTRYICDAGGPNRLVPFQLSPSQQYILEFGDNGLRFYTNNGRIETSPGVPYQIPTPYVHVELWQLHFAQTGSVLYIVHPNHPVMKLIREFDTGWFLVPVFFVAAPAFQSDQDIGTASVNTGSVSIEIAGPSILASAPVFIQGDVGRQIVAGTGVAQINGLGGTTRTDPFTGATLYSNAIVGTLTSFDQQFYLNGTWFLRGGPSAWFSPGVFESSGSLWHGAPPRGSFNTAPVFATAQHPTDSSYQQSTGSAYVKVQYTAGFIDAFRITDVGAYIPFDGGYCQIIGVVGSTNIVVQFFNVTTVTEVDAFGNPLMAPVPPGAWIYEFSAFVNGVNPGAICFFGDRLFLAGAGGAVSNTFWGSGVGDYENFALGSLDTDGVRYSINSSSFEIIRWMEVYQGNIIMGGFNNEYVVNGGQGQAVQSAGAQITPSNINVIRQSKYGVSNVQAIEVDNDLLFIQRTKQSTYRFAFNAITSSYGSENLNILNEIITQDNIKEMVYVHQPDKIVWFTTEGNNLIGLTYDKQQDVWAWHRHFTGVDNNDQFNSVATITTGADSENDEVWLLCNRIRNGALVHTIELMDSTLNLDCAIHTISSTPVSQLTNLQYLQGRNATVVADGIVYPDAVIDNTGVYTFPSSTKGTDVQVGLNYQSYAKTVRPEPRTTVQGLIKRWIRLYVRLYQSLGLYINGQQVPFREPSDLMGMVVQPKTTDVNVINLGFDRDGYIVIEQRQPLPSNILAVFGAMEISDGI